MRENKREFGIYKGHVVKVRVFVTHLSGAAG